MARRLRPQPAVSYPLDLLSNDFRDRLEEGRKSPSTIKQYLWALARLRAWMADTGLPDTLDALDQKALSNFQRHLLSAVSEQTGRPMSPSTVDAAHRALSAFFHWAESAGYVDRNLILLVEKPKVQTRPLDVISDDYAKKLFKACEGLHYEDIRDTAILRTLWDSGGRRAEIGHLRVEDLHFEARIALVTGKGDKVRAVPFTVTTARALRRYLTMARPRHEDAGRPELWLGSNGPMTPDGIRHVLDKRVRLAGLPHLKPHQFRATMAVRYIRKRGNATSLRLIMGWESLQMVSRYTKAVETELALDEYHALDMDDF